MPCNASYARFDMHFYMHSYLHKIFILLKSGCYSAGDDGSGSGSGDDNGDVGAVPPIKHRRFSGTYWW
jgi:hypothetical protein